jgi:hypothetical protein
VGVVTDVEGLDEAVAQCCDLPEVYLFLEDPDFGDEAFR